MTAVVSIKRTIPFVANQAMTLFLFTPANSATMLLSPFAVVTAIIFATAFMRHLPQ